MATSTPLKNFLRPLVLSGPSGTGKSTLHFLFVVFKKIRITDTTRAPRPGEQDGVQYHFVTRDSFLALLAQNGFIEHAEFSGNLYGTSVQAVKDIAELGKRCILDIEVQVGRFSL